MVLVFSSCSVGGFLIGSKIDKKKNYISEQFADFQSGESIKVVTIYNVPYKGRFKFIEERVVDSDTVYFLVMTHKGREVPVPFDSIDRVVADAVQQKQKARWIGLGVGLAIDAAVVAGYIIYGIGSAFGE